MPVNGEPTLAPAFLAGGQLRGTRHAVLCPHGPLKRDSLQALVLRMMFTFRLREYLRAIVKLWFVWIDLWAMDLFRREIYVRVMVVVTICFIFLMWWKQICEISTPRMVIQPDLNFFSNYLTVIVLLVVFWVMCSNWLSAS